MMIIYKTATFAPVWTITLKIRASFVHQTLTEHALYFRNINLKTFLFHISFAFILWYLHRSCGGLAVIKKSAFKYSEKFASYINGDCVMLAQTLY